MNAIVGAFKFTQKVREQIATRDSREKIRTLLPTKRECQACNILPDLNDHVLTSEQLSSCIPHCVDERSSNKYYYNLFLNAITWLDEEKARYLQRSAGKHLVGERFQAFRLYNLQFPIIRDDFVKPNNPISDYHSHYTESEVFVSIRFPYDSPIPELTLKSLSIVRDQLCSHGYHLRIIDMLSIIYHCAETMFNKEFRARRHFRFKPFSSLLDKILYRQKDIKDMVRCQPEDRTKYEEIVKKLTDSEWVKLEESETGNHNHATRFYRWVAVYFGQISWCFPMWVEVQTKENRVDDHYIYEFKRLQRGNSYDHYLTIEIQDWNQDYHPSLIDSSIVEVDSDSYEL